VELAIESARKQDHLMDTQTMPKLYSDNGSGFTSRLLAGYLDTHGIKHVFGAPYHPQRRGKIEEVQQAGKAEAVSCRILLS
jgi:transposase InsO family protein